MAMIDKATKKYTIGCQLSPAIGGIRPENPIRRPTGKAKRFRRTIWLTIIAVSAILITF
jgi:hypothetical protein